MATFPFLIVHFFSKINMVQAVDDIDKLCKFQENLTTGYQHFLLFPHIF